MDAQVVVVGSYVQDHVWLVDRFPDIGETRRGSGFHVGPGGKGFNQAIACLRQGAPTLFVGAIGDDALGAAAQAFAAAEGLPCRWQRRSDVPTAAAGVLVDDAGANVVVVNLAANERLDPAHVAAQAGTFAAAKILLLQLESNLAAVAAALDLGARHGLLRVLNPAPMHADLDAALLTRCDVVTPNETEFALLLERFAHVRIAAATLAERDDADLHALARRLGVATVVVTLGAHGCLVSHAEADRHGDDAAYYRLAAEPARVLDSTGAGDAFSGALAAALLHFHGRPFRTAAEHANRAAALSTEVVGAAPAMPRFDAVARRFANGPRR